MTSHLPDRASAMIIGALVADAASMGLHWIYDQAHIRARKPDHPEFTAPDAANYAGARGYFAHEGKQAGELSHYGEQMMVMLRALSANKWVYRPDLYISALRKHFGYGGTFTGYIDHSTRETLNNFIRAEDDAMALARSIPFDGSESITTAMATKAMSLRNVAEGAELRRRFEEAVRITHSDDAIVAYGLTVLETLSRAEAPQGAVDEQFPAISKLPPLIAAYTRGTAEQDMSFASAIDSAVRVTNDHARSLAYGRVCAGMLESALEADDADHAVSAGLELANDEIAAALNQALDMKDREANEVTAHFGLACNLSYGVPAVVHNVTTAPDFAEAVRRNIYAGGDNCGRAILLGALMGALHGVGGAHGIPVSWIEQLAVRDELSALFPDQPQSDLSADQASAKPAEPI